MEVGEEAPPTPSRIILRSSTKKAIAAATGAILVFSFIYYRHTHVFALGSHQSSRAIFSAPEADGRIAAAKSRLRDSPEDLDALTQLAIAYYAKGPDSYVDAMNALDRARSLGATNESLFFYAGVMYESLGLPEYAANELKKYLRHYPKDYEALVRLGNLDFHQGLDDEAYDVYKKAIDLWPKDATVMFNFAVVCIRKGDLASAQAMLSQVTARAGGLPMGGLFEEGEIARIQGSTDTAISLYQQELTKTPDYLPALEALEAALRSKKQWKDARTLRSKISELKTSQHG